jgi:hypothetical protein
MAVRTLLYGRAGRAVLSGPVPSDFSAAVGDTTKHLKSHLRRLEHKFSAEQRFEFAGIYFEYRKSAGLRLVWIETYVFQISLHKQAVYAYVVSR